MILGLDAISESERKHPAWISFTKSGQCKSYKEHLMLTLWEAFRAGWDAATERWLNEW